MHTRILAALAITVGLTQASPAAEVELALSHWIPAMHPLQVHGIEPWVESISEASGGRIEITIYPSQQLGAAPDHYDMARDGVADITFINPGYQPGRFPILAAGELPFLLKNGTGGSRALDEWYAEYADQEMSDTYVCLVLAHDPGTLHAKEGPLQTPGDFEGKNIRPANATMARMVNMLGGASVQVPAPEIRELLSKGAADMTASPWNSLFTFGLESEVYHHLDVPFYAATFVFVMNKDRIDALSPEDKAVIEDHCTPEWAERIAAGWAEIEENGRQKIIDAGGHTLYTPSPEEMEMWREAAAPLTSEWKEAAANSGTDVDAALANLKEALKKNDALME